MLKWIGYILLAAVVVALITAPSEKKFSKFVYNNMDTTACKPYVSHHPYKFFFVSLFSLSYAKECTEVRHLKNLQAGNTIGGIGIPVYKEPVKYLGLFGKFWKL